LKNHTRSSLATGDHEVESLNAYICGLARPPVSSRDQSSLPVVRSMQWPSTRFDWRGPSAGCSGKVSTKMRSPATAMPPCPAFGSAHFHRMFSPRATDHAVATRASGAVQFACGPAACGQDSCDAHEARSRSEHAAIERSMRGA
jgi:hypothetical protein